MKTTTHLVVALFVLNAITQLSSQVNINATVQINGFRHNWDCGTDGTGSQDPDPRYKVWMGFNSGGFVQVAAPIEYAGCSGQGIFGGDFIACSNFNPGVINAYSIFNQPATTINVDMESWEEDGCGSECTKDACTFNSDDVRCGRLRIGDINIYSGPPCTNNTYTGDFLSGPFLSMTGRCSDNNGGGYGINQLILNWSFATSPTITTQPTAAVQGGPDRFLCIGTGTSMTVAVNSWNGWSLGMHYQWQVNTLTTNPVPSSGCPVNGWTNIPGATTASYVPPQTAGTLLYRCLITSNCATDFTMQTVATECVRITYQPYAAPIISSVCGLSISPNVAYNFCTTTVPNAGASVNSAYTWSVSPSAGVTIANLNSACTDITFTNNATYIITLTYPDACPAADATATCTVTISPVACSTIYVDGVTGNDANFGYETTPVQTLNRAFQLIAGSRTWIRVARGTYNEGNILQLQNNVIVEGGWVNTAGIWTKSTAIANQTIVNFSGQETINANIAHVVGFKADNDDSWALQDLTLNTAAAVGQTTSGNGKSNMVVYITNGSDNYTISRCKITAGNATNGNGASTAGWQGSPTFNGVPADPYDGNQGQNGSNGTSDNNFNGCDNGLDDDQNGGVGSPATTGGQGGNSPVAAGGAGGNGGGGGHAGDDQWSGCNGNSGTVGINGNNGAGPALGIGGAGGPCADCNCQNPGGNQGTNASANGANGTNGANGVAAFTTGYFTPGIGVNGTAGGGGSGGGGGGGAGIDITLNNEVGPGGGAGGSGGGGGGAGRGAFGGGGSFGIFIWNNGTGTNIIDCQVTSGTVGTGGIGGTGAAGGTAGAGGFEGIANGQRQVINNCGNGQNAGGGGDGSTGGTGGNGGSGANGLNFAIAVQGAGTNPTVTTSPSITLNSTTAGGSVPNPINLGVNYYENAKGCVNSEINISRNLGGTWILPGTATFENDINSTSSSFGVNSNNATVIFGAAGVYDVTTNGFGYNDVIRITDGTRTLPTIIVNPTVVCSGATFSLSASPAWGSEIDFEWIIFTNSATAPGDIIATSTQQIPSFTLSVATQTTYRIRYRVKEQCCGWSAPVYSTVTINPPVSTPVTPMGTTTFCMPAGSSVYTTTANNASSYNWSVTGAGNTVIGAGTTGTVFFDPAFNGTGQVCVTADGCAGPTATVCQTFNVNSIVGTPAIPVGISSRCIGLGVDTFATFASGASSYIWTVTGAGNGAGGTGDTALISWSSSYSGTAQVCVQAQGCGGPSAQVCAFVDVLPAVGVPIIPVGANPVCQDAIDGIYISSASDVSSYNWSITGGSGTITNNNDSVTVDWDPAFSGIAQICVTTNGCGASQGPVCLNVTVGPTVALPSTPSGTQIRCIGAGTDNYSSTASGATSYTWLISPVTAGTISPLGVVTWNALFSGTATVGVIANGCNGPSDTTFLAVAITGPVSDPSTPIGNAIRCQGVGSDIYSTTATNATSYTWSVTPPTAGTVAGTTSTETVNWDPLYSGSASVCVIAVGCNGNSSQICFNVEIDPTPATPTISVTGSTSFCDGGSAVLTSSSPTNNNWLPNNETTTSITVTQSGTYAVEVTNSFGCTSTSTNQSIVVFPNTINPVVIYSDTVCSSTPFNIIASGTNVVSYNWNTGDTTSIINPSITSQAVYSVTMTDNNGCTASSTFTIEVYPYPNAIDDNNTTNQDTAVITYVIFNDNMSGTLSVPIQPTNGSTMIVGDSIIYTPNPGYYGTDFFEYILCSKNCPTQCDTANVTIVVDQVLPLVIPGGFSPNGDGQNDVFFIQGLSNYPQNSLTVINRWGDIVYSAGPYNNDWDGSSNTGINIAGDHVTDGTYFYVFITKPGADPIKSSLEIRRNN